MRSGQVLIVALVGSVLCASAAAGQDRPAKATWSPDEKHFGTDAFVPDWRRAEELDAKATQRFLERHWPDFRATHDAGNQGGLPEGLTEAERTAGIVVFPVDYIGETLPSRVPTPAERQFKSMALFAAKGESEPFAIAVRALDAPKVVAVETTDLTGSGGTIAKADTANRLCLAWDSDLYKGRGKWAKEMQQVVLLKTPDNQWKFPPNYTMTYWVDVHVPAEAKPGAYTGQIHVKADGKVARTIDVAVEVLPFALKTNNFHAGCFRVTFNIWAAGFVGYYEEMIEMDSRYGYNIAGGFFNKGNEIPFTGAMETLKVDEGHEKFRKFDTTMKLLRKHGMGQVAFWNWGASGNVGQFNNVLKGAGCQPIQTEEGKKGFAHILRALKEAEEKHAWPEFVINPYDEALMDQEAVRHIIQAMPYVHAISPRSRVYMTEWHVGYTRLYQSSGRTLAGKSRPGDHGKEYKALAASGEREPLLNFHVIGANVYDPESRAIQDRFGGECWNYKGINRVSPQARYAQGFGSYVMKNEASLLWANYSGNFDEPSWTMHYVMPDERASRYNTRGPVLASVRAAIGREGIDDRKYIETLKFHARTRKSVEDLKFLDEELPRRCVAMADLKDVGGIDNTQERVTNASVFQKLRTEVKDRILRLLK
ncbi:MAG TPA: hypothetical protein VNE39_11690 [Planctomycetota bacterium]|nr:hypothetical protein [Planctomycetota bacterium]